MFQITSHMGIWMNLGHRSCIPNSFRRALKQLRVSFFQPRKVTGITLPSAVPAPFTSCFRPFGWLTSCPLKNMNESQEYYAQ